MRCAPWYETAFGAHYLKVYAHRSRDEAEREVDFIVRALGLQGDERIIDICCGAGRHALALGERGYPVTGIDLSAELLADAQTGRRSDVDVQFVNADMRRLPFADEVFDVALNLFTSFGYFDDADNERALAEMARVVRRGGRLLMDFLNRDVVERGLVPESERESEGVRVREKRSFNAETGHVIKHVTLSGPEGDLEYTERVRAYSSEELQDRMRRCGLHIQRLYGGLDGSDFSETAQRLVIVAEK